jgi:hypothetical protein
LPRLSFKGAPLRGPLVRVPLFPPGEMTPRFVWLYAVALVLGTAFLWWMTFPEMPKVAIGKGMLAGAIATLGVALFGWASGA